jgi:chromosomal replication initiator protein
VVEYLADNISANIREIEGALLSLKANAQYLNRRISTSLAKEVLKAYVHVSQKEISVNRITEIVCEYFNIDLQDFNSQKRTREVAQARQVAMYLAKQHTKLPLASIGAAIGGRNHATVLHSCKSVTNFIETDKAFKAQIDEVEKLIAKG